ncbi:MAG: ATP-binding cassette domain-containing protein, partial [Spirochaetia bacterium]|nr:ATP-binding cassette domain-containing protein [Spirochaetia bacterium]
LLKDFTALENVYMSAYMQGESKKNAVKKAEQLLADVGLKDRMNHLPSELSGGERQRVAVARALINSPSLILADEPTGNLDPENAVLISNLLFEMADKYEKTLILVTHDEKIAEKGSEIYKIIQGNLVRK